MPMDVATCASPEPWLAFLVRPDEPTFPMKELGDALKGIFDKVGQFLDLFDLSFPYFWRRIGWSGFGCGSSSRIGFHQCDGRGCWFCYVK